MKKDVWGVRTIARQLGTSRDTIRHMIENKGLSPSLVKRKGCMCFGFDEKRIKKIKEYLAQKKKAA